MTTPPGVIEMPVGLIVKLTAFETAPPPAAVMLALPAAAIRFAGTVALNCVALMDVVASGEPFHCTVAPETKPVPVTVNVKAAPPAVAEIGVIAVIAREGVIGWLRMAIATGPFPVAKGEPGAGVKAPLPALIVYAEIVLEK